jgi:hypothetical protein
MASVLIQAGHAPQDGAGERGSVLASAPGYRSLPGEARWTARLAERLAARLREAGVRVTIVGEWRGRPAPPEVERHHQLFLSLRYDAAGYAASGDPRGDSGCFADRAIGDPVASLSDLAIREWERVYPRERGGTPIPLASDRRGPSTSQHYAFRSISGLTPGVILVHGCGAPVGSRGLPPGEDAPFLHGQSERVADLDARAVLRFLERTAARRAPWAHDRLPAQGRRAS